MTCAQVAASINLHLANGGVVLDTYGLCPAALIKGIADSSDRRDLSRIQLTSYGSVSTTVGDDIDDFTLTDGVIRYQTKDDRYGANGTIQFLNPAPCAVDPDPVQVCDECGKPAFDDSNLCGSCLWGSQTTPDLLPSPCPRLKEMYASIQALRAEVMGLITPVVDDKHDPLWWGMESACNDLLGQLEDADIRAGEMTHLFALPLSAVTAPSNDLNP